MISLIRNYILADDIIQQFLTNNKVKNAIFLEHKPNVDVRNYIIIKEKPLQLDYIEKYQLDFHIYSKDLNKIIEVEKALKRLLNDVRGNKLVYDDDVVIRDMRQLAGGGRQFITDSDSFISVKYFQITI